MPRPIDPVLVTGASGYVGRRLLGALANGGHDVRALSRRPERAGLPAGTDVRRGDALSGDGLAEALAGCRTAYHLIHSMDGAADFAARDNAAARRFATAARAAGVERVVYLGGLGGDTATSEHLRSRDEVAAVLAAYGPPVVHVRWVETRTRPVAATDAVRALIAVAEHDEALPEIRLGGADVLTDREMMARCAGPAGRRPRPLLKVPMSTSRLSSSRVALVTPVGLGLIEPRVEGLGAEMPVQDPPPAGINDAPVDFDDAARAALP